jgi:hypothetical protein
MEYGVWNTGHGVWSMEYRLVSYNHFVVFNLIKYLFSLALLPSTTLEKYSPFSLSELSLLKCH